MLPLTSDAIANVLATPWVDLADGWTAPDGTHYAVASDLHIVWPNGESHITLVGIAAAQARRSSFPSRRFPPTLTAWPSATPETTCCLDPAIPTRSCSLPAAATMSSSTMPDSTLSFLHSLLFVGVAAPTTQNWKTTTINDQKGVIYDFDGDPDTSGSVTILGLDIGLVDQIAVNSVPVL